MIELLFGIAAIAFGWYQIRLMRLDREAREAQEKTTKED